MSVWLIRAGKDGEDEARFLSNGKAYLGWPEVNIDLSLAVDRQNFTTTIQEFYPDRGVRTVRNWASQIWPFVFEMKIGDTVITPLRRQAGIMVGTITGEYKFEGARESRYFHSRTIDWRHEPVPRSNFSQDLLYTFGAFMTICRIQRNNAESRIAKMQQLNWAAESAHAAAVTTATDQDEQVSTDLQALADDQVARFIQARFSGHAMERLVEGILRAQGYTTSRSPIGPDGGSDIVAGFGALGFGEPRLVVEVKTGAAVGREAVDKLLGAVKKFNATQGLFISWNGFKSNVRGELAQSFFDVRLWDRTDLLSALFANYDRLAAELKAELPLKPVWTIADEDGEDE
jgi:restriction system protein